MSGFIPIFRTSHVHFKQHIMACNGLCVRIDDRCLLNPQRMQPSLTFHIRIESSVTLLQSPSPLYRIRYCERVLEIWRHCDANRARCGMEYTSWWLFFTQMQSIPQNEREYDLSVACKYK